MEDTTETNRASAPSECDVVVIGAGIGGLTAAALLSRAGLRVAVLEAADRPGGYLAGFSRGGFHFDTAIHWLNQCGQGGVARKIFDLIGDDAPSTPSNRRIRRYKGAAHDYLLTDAPDELRDAWIRDFPGEEAGIRAFFAAARRLGAAFAALSAASRSAETMSVWEKARALFRATRAGLSFLPYLGANVERGLDRFFGPAGVRRIFCSEETLISCLMPVGWAYGGDFQTPPQGGSRAFPAWLCRALDRAGAAVLCRTRAERIVVENGRVAGVRYARATSPSEAGEIRCRYAVAACDVQSVYESLLPAGAVSARTIERIRGVDLYDSAVTVSLGLDVDPGRWGFGGEIASLTRDDIDRAGHSRGDPHTAALTVLAPSVQDPTLAPPGKGTLAIYAPARMSFCDCWKTGPGRSRGPAYRELKERYADVLVARVAAALAPGLEKHVEVRDVATPVTYWRYTGNRDGVIMAARPTRRNIAAKVAGNRTPVGNLLLGGQWAEYGGGLPGAVRAATNASLIILRRESPAFFAAAKRVVDGEITPAQGRGMVSPPQDGSRDGSLCPPGARGV